MFRIRFPAIVFICLAPPDSFRDLLTPNGIIVFLGIGASEVSK
jgi:hypothetical protein